MDAGFLGANQGSPERLEVGPQGFLKFLSLGPRAGFNVEYRSPFSRVVSMGGWGVGWIQRCRGVVDRVKGKGGPMESGGDLLKNLYNFPSLGITGFGKIRLTKKVLGSWAPDFLKFLHGRGLFG